MERERQGYKKKECCRCPVFHPQPPLLKLRSEASGRPLTLQQRCGEAERARLSQRKRSHCFFFHPPSKPPPLDAPAPTPLYRTFLSLHLLQASTHLSGPQAALHGPGSRPAACSCLRRRPCFSLSSLLPPVVVFLLAAAMASTSTSSLEERVELLRTLQAAVGSSDELFCRSVLEANDYNLQVRLASGRHTHTHTHNTPSFRQKFQNKRVQSTFCHSPWFTCWRASLPSFAL